MFKLKDALVAEMKKQKPDILVLIDYPDFNWRLAKEAKKMNIPVFSYIPPSAWAWRKGRAKEVAKIADKIVAIFPFELDVYKKAGADISFVGNPLMDNVRASMSREMAAEFFGIDLKEDNILLLPGSRKQEIANLLEPMLQAAQLIKKERPEVKFFLPVATGIDKKYLEAKINEYGLTVKLCETKTYDLMNCCDFAIATSGTVTLEAALMGLPSIVLYKMSAITYRIAKIFVKIKYFSLPNILVDKQMLPELLQDEVNGENIARFARDLYKDTESAKKVKEELLMVKEKLGSPGVADKTAELILQTADRFKNEIKG